MCVFANNHIDGSPIEVILVQPGKRRQIPNTEESILSNSEQLKTIVTETDSHYMISIMSIHPQQDHILSHHISHIIIIRLQH